MRKTIIAFMQDRPGVLNRVASMIRRRDFALGQGEVRHAVRTRKTVQETNLIFELLGGLASSMDYIYQAETALPAADPWQVEAARVRQEQIGWLRSPDQRGDSSLLARLKGGLANLQDAYIQRYLELHRRARLDATQDMQKKRLTSDPHWGQLRILSGLDFLSRGELQKLEERLGNLRSCPSLSAGDLRARPFCPSCGLNPRTLNVPNSASEQLTEVGRDFDHLYQKWLNGLRENLKSDSSQANLALIAEREREQIRVFIQSGELPEKMNDRFMAALRDTLQGLEKVTLEGADLLLALTRPGMPCTSEEFETRFRNFIRPHLEGKDQAKVRIQIDW